MFRRCFAIIICILCVSLITGCPDLDKITIGNPDISKVQDGTHFGESKVGPVKVKVNVITENGKITNIELLEHDNGLGKKAESIIPKVIENQSLQVDAVSGATASSKAILLAIEEALKH